MRLNKTQILTLLIFLLSITSISASGTENSVCDQLLDECALVVVEQQTTIDEQAKLVNMLTEQDELKSKQISSLTTDLNDANNSVQNRTWLSAILSVLLVIAIL